jgi:hypothetical protein
MTGCGADVVVGGHTHFQAILTGQRAQLRAVRYEA